MIRSLLALLMLSSLLHAEIDDKTKHVAVSFVLGYGFNYGIERYTQAENIDASDLFKVTAATAAALTIGLAKELYDDTQEGNRFSWADLTADFGGAIVGALLSNYIHRKNSDFTFAMERSVIRVGYRF